MIFFLGYHFDTLYQSNEQENKERHEGKKFHSRQHVATIFKHL